MSSEPVASEVDVEQMATRYHRALVGYFKKFGARTAEAEDLAQATWQKYLAGQGPAFDPTLGRGFYTFLCSFYARGMVRQRKTPKRDFIELDDIAISPPAPLYFDEIEQQLRAFDELFRLLFLCGGYPHEQLATAWLKYADGQDGEQQAAASAIGEFDRVHGRRQLTELCERFSRFCGRPVMTEADWRPKLEHLLPMKRRLLLTVNELLHSSAASGPVVGQTCIADYYFKTGALTTIPNWCQRVKEKIRQCLGLEPKTKPEEAIIVAAAATTDGPPLGCMRERCKLHKCCPEMDRAGVPDGG